MKDRIRKIMESQHMTQQTFAQFIQMSPASLSSIFNGRTKPTLNIIEAIKQKIPALSTDWLMFGRGPMYTDEILKEESPATEEIAKRNLEPQLDFDASPTPLSEKNSVKNEPTGSHATLQKSEMEVLKNFDKKPRQITEIRIFFDDQTWETFVPKR